MELYRLTNDLNLRPNPNSDPPSLGVFKMGTVVEGIRTNAEGTWLFVHIPKTEGGFHEGWMSLKFLKRLAAAPLNWRLGVNLREFAYYGSGVGQIQATSEGLRDQQLGVCHDTGIQLVRFFASRLQFDTAKSLLFIRKALDTISGFGMQAIVALDDSLNGAEQYMQGNNDFHKGDGGHLITRYWQEKFYRQTYLPHISTIVAEFRNHPAVLMWELGNEYGLYPQPPVSGDDTAFVGFVKEASQEIKRLAPNHLVSLGLISSHVVYSQSQTDDRQRAARRLYSLANIDAVGVHYYRENFNDLKEFIDIDVQVAKDLGKPFYIGEIGARAGLAGRPEFFAKAVAHWKKEGAFTVMPWQLDSSHPFDVGIGDKGGFARWRDDDYAAILGELKALA